MSIESPKVNINKDDYATVGAGAVLGGAGTYGILSRKQIKFGQKMIDALNKNKSECDTFIKKHDNLISKATSSKRGFFGKLNKSFSKLSPDDENLGKTIKDNVANVIGKYRAKSIEKLGENATKEQIKTLEDKLISKDITKSLKNAAKFENILKISGAVVLGAVGLSILRQIGMKLASNRIINKTEKEVAKDELKAGKETDKKELKAGKEADKKELKTEKNNGDKADKVQSHTNKKDEKTKTTKGSETVESDKKENADSAKTDLMPSKNED